MSGLNLWRISGFKSAIPFLAAFVLVSPAAGVGRPDVAALQVALRARGLYGGTIDGVLGASTARGVRRLQRHARLPVDGVFGPRTRRALGRYARHRLGTRQLRLGNAGWDVAALQFELAWHGFPSAAIDGRFGGHVERAVRRYQVWAGLTADGVAGPAVLAALRRPLPHCAIALAWPVSGPLGDPFGPRGNRFHSGIDIPAAMGTAVGAARSGTVTFAGWHDGWGNLVVVRHASGVRTWYAHLSRITVRKGAWITTGTRVGRVGASGEASGPHLHFEVRVRNAAVDPLTALHAVF
jgi:peptidoglycan hydrolase-like protein with peptidoglycan-binding domain